MLKPQQIHQSRFIRNLLPFPSQFIHGFSTLAFLPLHNSKINQTRKNVKLVFRPTPVKATLTNTTDKSVAVKATVVAKQTVTSFIKNIGIQQGLDEIQDLLGKTLLLELVAAHLDPKTGLEKKRIKGYAHRVSKDGSNVKYEAEFEFPADFGEIGAVVVENEHHKEIFIEDIVFDGVPNGTVSVNCNSWVHSKFDNPRNRVFFTNKSYLPSETPSGLRKLREDELLNLQGNGQGERKSSERIYDYDVYNDLGDIDTEPTKKRSILGGKDFPYPRRCRTGRPRCRTDPSYEKWEEGFYVPRDEAFSEVKQLTFSTNFIYSMLTAIIPSLEASILDPDMGFPNFNAIDELYTQGLNLPTLDKKELWKSVLPRLIKTVSDEAHSILRFETPETLDRDKFFWLRDEEFARQTLAGLNPLSIKLVTEWPLKSILDPETYGPAESAITTDLIQREINEVMTVHKAIDQKRLFILDYHDLFLPYAERVRDLKGRALYGSRTIFFLNPDETLKPIAIELTRPPMDGKPQWKEVYTPCLHSTGDWLWKLAKTQVLAHDSIYHQLVSHWLRTHACGEPYVIATNRCLSVMHPIYRLLHPHLRYTMEINALARESLVAADGPIEKIMTLGKYYLEVGSVFYDQHWRFDQQSLPADLISRGMAEEDPSVPQGLRLTIKDYPYASDGLLLWDALKQWVTEYVNHYYPNPSMVEADQELQAWWTEIRTVGHGDKKDEPWWPVLKTPKDLIEILMTIIWVATGQHAAVNFGQYTYAGYFPSRPSFTRAKMPNEDPTDNEWRRFLRKPEVALLECLPSQIQATRAMAVWDVISHHSPDEEYVGDKPEPSWVEDPVIRAAFERLHGKLKQVEGIIDERNGDCNLKNRNGAGITPYELLKPFSEPGVTGMGVPNSVSI
ncbi:Linoleate 13S-lipoxygenase 2-1 [Hibiscus syriacus]|uniref:Lipoxygenase n=1 Tax=Hibiscus syriacus TaxID=106335 RepID=A0A6A3B109_HIBSY|nr:Linoleate 13S-lipoxygenase 2-1 [Hibiscus syriacus]